MKVVRKAEAEIFKNLIQRSVSRRRSHISSFELLLHLGFDFPYHGRFCFAPVSEENSSEGSDWLPNALLALLDWFFLSLPPASSSAGNLWLQMVGWTDWNVSNYQTRKKLGFNFFPLLD